MPEVAVKPGRHREATLYHALAGAGARRRTHARASCARRALRAYETSELPVWRRSGFWTTSLAGARPATRSRPRAPRRPSPASCRRSSRARCPSARARAGSCSATARSCTSSSTRRCAERGVILCSLEDASREHPELFEPLVLQAPDDRPPQARGRQRRVLERRRLPVRARRASSSRSRSRSSTRSSEPGVRAVRAHARRRRTERASSACTSTTSPRTSRARRCTRARSSSTSRTARAAASRSSRTGARARCSTSRPAFVGVGRDAYCHWLPALLGGHLIRQHLELAVSEPGGDMAFRGLFFTEERRAPRRVRGRPARDRALGRRRALARRRHRREPRELRGPDPDRPGRPADPHLPADPLDDALAEGARSTRSPRCSSPPTTSRPRTAAPSASSTRTAIFYMQTRGLDRPAAVRVIVEGFFEPLIAELADEPLEAADAREDRARSSPRRARTSRRYATSR